MVDYTETLTRLFTVFDQCQQVYCQDIAKEHNAHIALIFNARAEELPPYFQQSLKTASDQRDAYGHMASIIGTKQILMCGGENQDTSDLHALFTLAHETKSLTGMAVTLERTEALLDELNQGLDANNTYDAEETAIAQRMAAGCEVLIDKVKEMQGICISLQ